MHEHDSYVASATPSPSAVPSPAPPVTSEVVEVVFKGRRREYYGNPREIPVHVDDYIIVQAERGEDLGRIHHTNEWVKASQLPQAPRPILRHAGQEDMERLEQNRAKEEKAFASCKEKVFLRDLDRKSVV